MSNHKHTVHHVRLSHISIAPALAVIPMMIDVAGRFLTSAKPDLKKVGVELKAEHAALMTSLDTLGILEPIKAYRAPAKAGTTEQRWVAIDGRHRLEWAEDQANQPNKTGDDEMTVPLLEVSEAEAQAIIEASVIGRRHWTKGQRAWLGVMQHPQVCQATNTTRSDSVGADNVNNATALAMRLGVSADLVSQAAELYRKFYAPGAKPGSPAAIEAEAARGKYEHLIWGGAGLGAILAGIGGGDATGGKPKAPTGFHHLDAPLASLTRLSKHWMAWSADERSKAQSLIAARIRGNDETPGWPSEFCLAIGEAMAAAGI